MANVTFNVDDFLKSLDFTEEAVRRGAERGMNDNVDDLARISSEIAPHDGGTLEKSYSKEVDWDGNTIVGTVEYSISEKDRNGNFNYALWTHESEYKLGEGSIAKQISGGTQGNSGRSYGVGNKYLERPLKGESDYFKRHLADEIRKEIGK